MTHWTPTSPSSQPDHLYDLSVLSLVFFSAKAASIRGTDQPRTPLSIEVRRHIGEPIRSSERRPDGALTSEKMLVERPGISMIGLREADDEATTCGAQVRQRGRGTLVARHSQDRSGVWFAHPVRHASHKTHQEGAQPLKIRRNHPRTTVGGVCAAAAGESGSAHAVHTLSSRMPKGTQAQAL
jgi:DNA-binding FadR family transcriptional regulator